MPTPRNESVASTDRQIEVQRGTRRTAPASACSEDVPAHDAARPDADDPRSSTYSLRRSTMVDARTMRQHRDPTAPGSRGQSSRAATPAYSSRKVAVTRHDQQRRDRQHRVAEPHQQLSIQPPRKPAIRSTYTTVTASSTTLRSPMTSEMRQPWPTTRRGLAGRCRAGGHRRPAAGSAARPCRGRAASGRRVPPGEHQRRRKRRQRDDEQHQRGADRDRAAAEAPRDVAGEQPHEPRRTSRPGAQRPPAPPTTSPRSRGSASA